MVTSIAGGRKVTKVPDCLVRYYDDYSQSRLGKSLLLRLLNDQRMKTAWIELRRRVKSDKEWIDVWRSIIVAKQRSRSASRLRTKRSSQRDKYKDVAKRCAALAKKIDNGPLDLLAYELFSDDVFASCGTAAFHKEDALQRDQIARRVLGSWPSAPELLRNLGSRAQALSQEAMTKPRLDNRASGNPAARIFVGYLGAEFRRMFGTPLLNTLALITEVTFEANEPVSKSFVQGVLRKV